MQMQQFLYGVTSAVIIVQSKISEIAKLVQVTVTGGGRMFYWQDKHQTFLQLSTRKSNKNLFNAI